MRLLLSILALPLWCGGFIIGLLFRPIVMGATTGYSLQEILAIRTLAKEIEQYQENTTDVE